MSRILIVLEVDPRGSKAINVGVALAEAPGREVVFFCVACIPVLPLICAPLRGNVAADLIATASKPVLVVNAPA